jgi:hypothetical protein
MELPKQNINSILGEQGLTIVKGIVERDLNWIFRKNHQENDYGIDAFIDLTTEIRQVTGKSIALQIKTGQSYFKERNSIGWIYRGEIGHLNYYLNHQIPVLILLVNEINNKVNWCLCDANKTEQAGNNWKITVPFNQELNINSKVLLGNYVSPVIDYASPLQNFWDQNKFLKDLGRIVFIVDKQTIIDKRYSELVNGIEKFRINEGLLEASQGKVDIGIHGYDDDKRELYEIREVQEWTNLIFKNVKGLSYFLATDEFAHFLRIIEYCALGYQVLFDYVEEGKMKKRVEVKFKDSSPFFENLFNDLNVFCEKNNIPIEVNKQISFKLFKYLTGEDLF